MKSVILFVLITGSITLFAQARFSMTKADLKMMNEIIDAMDTTEVKTFADNATFDSVHATYSADGKTATYDIAGEVLIEGDIACGELRLTLNRVTHVSNEASWNTYTAKLDTTRLADYCEIKYKGAIR